MNTAECLINLKNLSKVYRTESVETTALNAINIEVEKGEFVAVMGPFGYGKSKLLNALGAALTFLTVMWSLKN